MVHDGGFAAELLAKLATWLKVGLQLAQRL
jgi:hypothetical protein